MKSFFGFAAVLALASVSQAAIVTYTLSINDNGTHTYTPGRFAVYATTSNGDNAGLQGFGFYVVGDTSITNRSPNVTFTNDDTGETRTAGFTLLRTAVVGGQITGAEDVVVSSGTPTGIVAFGIGQQAGNLATLAPVGFTSSSLVTGAYLVPVLLATGNFTTTPSFSSDPLSAPAASVFRSTNSTPDVDTNPTIVSTTTTLTAVPEPATFALLVIGGVGTCRRRRTA